MVFIRTPLFGLYANRARVRVTGNSPTAEERCFNWGLCPQPPGIYRFRARMLLVGRLAPPLHSGRWVGAPVASLRCRTLRPGKVSIKRFRHKILAPADQIGLQPRLP